MLGDFVELATTVVHPDHEPDIGPGGSSGREVGRMPRRRQGSKSQGADVSSMPPPASAASKKSVPALPQPDRAVKVKADADATAPLPELLSQRLQSIGPFVGAVALSLALELVLNIVALQTPAKTELAEISQTEPTGSQITWLLAEKLALLAVFWFGDFDAYDVASLTLLSTTPISILLVFFYNIHGATVASKTVIGITAHTIPYLLLRQLSRRQQVLGLRAIVLAVVVAVETVVFAVGQLQGVEWEGALGYAGLWAASVVVVAAALDWVGGPSE
ncbi:hypothetical protein DV736_g4489, partial [Chaetothyriales sp. CBS 134916]